MTQNTPTEHTPNFLGNRLAIGLLLAFFALGLLRAIGYAFFDTPLGYDPGIFRETVRIYFDTLPQLPGPDAPSWLRSMHEPLFGIVSDLFLLQGISKDFFVWPLLALVSAASAAYFYLLSKPRFGRDTAVIAFVLASVSVVQFEAYWWNYWRNILGILLALTSFSLLDRKKWLAILPMAALFAMHRPTALLFSIVVIFWALAEWIRTRRFPGFFLVTGLVASAIALPLYIDRMTFLVGMVAPVVSTVAVSTRSGTFYESRDFFLVILPMLVLALPGIFRKMERKQFDVVFVGFLVGLAWSAFRLFFYNRMFLFFDVFVILFAAYSFAYAWHSWQKRKWKAIAAWAVIAIQCVSYGIQLKNSIGRHTIAPDEFELIRNLDTILPKSATILSTHKYYSPWIMGYSNHPTIAPWLFDVHVWTDQEWLRFYETPNQDERCKMIQAYKTTAPDLYVFVGRNQPRPELPETCFKPFISRYGQVLIYHVSFDR